MIATANPDFYVDYYRPGFKGSKRVRKDREAQLRKETRAWDKKAYARKAA